MGAGMGVMCWMRKTRFAMSRWDRRGDVCGWLAEGKTLYQCSRSFLWRFTTFTSGWPLVFVREVYPRLWEAVGGPPGQRGSVH